jgi:DNA-binding MarR family transcriptional regulator
MVENKHSINTILSFGAKSVNPELLEKLLVGREDIVNLLEKKVNSIVHNKDNLFLLVIGQRGMGKTHLLKVLHTRIWKFSLEEKLKIAYFAEEEYGVCNFFDFLLRVLNALIKWYEEDKEFLQNQVEKLQNTSIPNQLSFLEKIIKDYVKDKPLLIINENFGEILEQMGQEEQGRLRAWLYENNNVSIIASCQSISDDFDKEDRPFYGFFTPYYLKNLSFDESFYYLMSLAKTDKDVALIAILNTKGKPQVRAIYDLVKGNHRLLITFYQFLKADNLAKVSDNFIKTINDLKPYYETYIRYLPAQQQKILRYVALSRKPQLGVEISKNCFIEQKTLSKQLSELNRKNLIDIIPNPSDKRNKIYDINEPLLRISIEVGEHKEGITALFIDFLVLYYNLDELLIKLSSLSENIFKYDEIEINDKLKKLDALSKAIIIKNQNFPETFKKLEKAVLENNFEKAKEIYFKNIVENENDLMQFFAISLFDKQKYDVALLYFRKIDEDKLSDFGKDFFNVVIDYYTSTLIILYHNKNDSEYINEGVKLSEKFYFKNKKYDKNYILIRLIKSLICFDKKDENYKKYISEVLKIDYKLIVEKNKLQVAISTIYQNQEQTYTQKYIEYFKTLTLEERLEVYNEFKNINIYLFITLNEIIEKDLQITNIDEVLTNWFLNLLIQPSENKEKNIDFVLQFIDRNRTFVELTIIEIYIKTYKEVIFNKNENALYELPKEQRLFFESKILKR